MVNHFIRQIKPFKKRKEVQALFKQLEINSIGAAEQWEKLGSYERRWAKKFKAIRENQLPLEAKDGRISLMHELEQVILEHKKDEVITCPKCDSHSCNKVCLNCGEVFK